MQGFRNIYQSVTLLRTQNRSLLYNTKPILCYIVVSEIDKETLIIVGVVAGGVVLLIVITVGVACVKYRNKRKRSVFVVIQLFINFAIAVVVVVCMFILLSLLLLLFIPMRTKLLICLVQFSYLFY